MWKVRRPDITAKSAFETSISRIRDADLKDRMNAITETVEDAGKTYAEEAENGSLYRIARSNGINGSITTAEMTSLYNGRMVHSKGPARPIYDQLLAAAEYGRCPLCGHRDASTLDHVLSKAHFPVFAVTPDNLVPACSDCNKTKSDAPITEAAEQYLHPYFDNIEGTPWLRASVVETSPAAVKFHVVLPPEAGILGERVKNHFNKLGLAKLYAAQAGQELVNIRHQMSARYAQSGAAGVRYAIAEIYASRLEARVNSWQTAFYAALLESDWYCGGGFA